MPIKELLDKVKENVVVNQSKYLYLGAGLLVGVISGGLVEHYIFQKPVQITTVDKTEEVKKIESETKIDTSTKTEVATEKTTGAKVVTRTIKEYTKCENGKSVVAKEVVETENSGPVVEKTNTNIDEDQEFYNEFASKETKETQKTTVIDMRKRYSLGVEVGGEKLKTYTAEVGVRAVGDLWVVGKADMATTPKFDTKFGFGFKYEF